MQSHSRHRRIASLGGRATRLGIPFLASTALVVLTAAPGLSVAAAASNKQAICHATHSNHNPYVQESPAKSGDVSGHAGHTGPVWDPSLKASHIAWGDIIPPFDYDDKGVTKHFPGLNWTIKGQSIFNNGCSVAPPVLTLNVVKTNDANGNGGYSGDETTMVPAASVPFQIAVTNTSDVSIAIDTVTDAVGATLIPISCVPALVGSTLAPGATATCGFTLAGYSPPDGQSKTNTVTVAVHEGSDGNPGDENVNNTATASDSSIVRTAVPVLSLSVMKTNDASGDSTFHATETATSAGSSVPFRVVVTNTSAVPLALDGLTDVVGAAASVPVTCLVPLPATLAAGMSATCDFTLANASPAAGGSLLDTVTAAGHQPGNAANTTSSTSSSTVLTAAAGVVANPPDLKIVKAGPAGPLVPGGTSSYTLTVTNDGLGTATTVVVDDAMPPQTTLWNLTAPGFTCTGGGVHCTYGSPLAAGSSVSLTVVLALSGSYSGTSLTNTAVVGPTDPTPGDNSSTVTTQVAAPAAPAGGSPDLKIVKTGPVSAVHSGDDLTYTLVVTNDGTASATTVLVADELPAGTTRKSMTAAGWTCVGNAVHCTKDTPLASGGTATITVVLTLAGNYVPSSVSNTATVGPTDATPDDNTSTVTTPVIHAPDLKIVKTAPATVTAGKTLSWVLTVTNDGDAEATVVTVTDVLPAGVTFGALSAAGWTCSGTASLSCTLAAPLAVGASASLTIDGVVSATLGAATVANTAVVAPVDATPADNTSTAVTTVVTETSGNGGGAGTPAGDPGVPSTITGGGGSLAFTGLPTETFVRGAAWLLGVGALLVVLGRRRKHAN